MKTDGHMHPNLLRQPDRFDEFARYATESGFEAIVITDHMPLSVSDAHDRIPAGKVGDYCRALDEKKRQYRGKLTVLTGIEIDYHPDFETEIKEVLSAGVWDRVLGSTHLQLFGVNRQPGMTPQLYARLCLENTLAAVRTGWFQVIPHLDFFRVVTDKMPEPNDVDEAPLIPLLREIFSEMVSRSVMLEINTHRLVHINSAEAIFPSPGIMEVAAGFPLKYCYGSDAHSAENVGSGYELVMGRGRFEKQLKKAGGLY